MAVLYMHINAVILSMKTLKLLSLQRSTYLKENGTFDLKHFSVFMLLKLGEDVIAEVLGNGKPFSTRLVFLFQSIPGSAKLLRVVYSGGDGRFCVVNLVTGNF